EGREAEQRVRPHVETAETDAKPGAELRPERLHVADALQILADFRIAPAFLIGRELVVGAALGNRLHHLLRSQDAGQNGIVRTLDARNVDETSRAAHQHTAREDGLWNRLPATLGDGACT